MSSTDPSHEYSHYFEDLPVPDQIWPLSHEVTWEEIVNIAQLYEPIPFHLDEKAAAAEGAPALIAPSVLVPALVVKLIHLNTPPAAVVGVGKQDEVRFLAPIHAGDTLRLKTELIEKREAGSTPDRGLVRTRFALVNQHDDDVFSTINSVWFRKRQRKQST